MRSDQVNGTSKEQLLGRGTPHDAHHACAAPAAHKRTDLPALIVARHPVPVGSYQGFPVGSYQGFPEGCPDAFSDKTTFSICILFYAGNKMYINYNDVLMSYDL